MKTVFFSTQELYSLMVTLQYLNTAVHAAGPRCERSAAVSTAVEGLTSQHCSSTAVEGSFFWIHSNSDTLCIQALQRHCSNMDILTSFSGYISFGYIHYPGTAVGTAVTRT